MLIINLITKHRNKVDANYTTVNRAKEILPRKCDVRAQHIFKEANTIVDWLANFGLI
jgi:DNA-directed RNA polymerase subunit F